MNKMFYSNSVNIMNKMLKHLEYSLISIHTVLSSVIVCISIHANKAKNAHTAF